MAESGGVELLSFVPSPYVARVKIALAYKGVESKDIPQDLINKGELLLKLNPVFKSVPVLVHDGKVVCESMNIVQYVDEAWPSSGGANLLPADSYERAQARFWADFVDKKVIDALTESIKARAMEAAEERKAAEEKMVAALITLQDVALVGEGPFFGGGQIGLLDVAVAPLATLLIALEEQEQFTIPWSEKLPRLQAVLEALRSHPAAAGNLPEPAVYRDYLSRVVLPAFRQFFQSTASTPQA